MERIGNYGVVRKLGQGGMGTVWLARSRGGRLLAVKVARQELAADPAFRARFRAEVAAARSVGGFHTAPVVDADPEAEAPWLATAYVPGPTLAELLAAEGPMDERRLRALGAALAEALQAIHRCGLVHRDLKPGNIIMAEDGPRVLDFGIARAVESTRLTATGTAFGTPGFLAPEQAEGQDVGPAADVFALGAVLVAAAGGSAFGGGTPMVLMYRSVHQEADLSAVPQGLRPMVAACMDKAPARRPGTEQLLDWFSPVQGAPGPAELAPTSYGLAPPAPPRPPAAPTPTAPPTQLPGFGPSAPVPAQAPPPRSPGTPAPGVPAVPATAPPVMPASAPPAVPATAPPLPAMPPYAPAPVAPSAPPHPQAAGQMYGQALAVTALPPSPYAPGAPIPPAAGPGRPPGPAGPPEFLAMDRKNAVVLDAAGISLGANGRVVDFPWSAIDVAWCEKGQGHGQVLVVVLTLHDGSIHDCSVTTRDPAELDAWIAQFDALLAYYSPEE